MNKAMIEDKRQVGQEAFFELTKVGGVEVVGAAKIDSRGRIFTFVDNEWRRFRGDKQSLEEAFDLKPLDYDPSSNLDSHSLPSRSS